MTAFTEKQGVPATSTAGPIARAIPAVAIVVIASYVGAQMIADIASMKIAVIGGLAVDMGTFIYPITFTLRDLVHKIVGEAQRAGTHRQRCGHQPVYGGLFCLGSSHAWRQSG
ncbi:MAG: hypothetical protein M5U34_30145 [Chloroflexi bacterium]|nr:hypothetical protein [Chloroflexota bacterium]